jgi:hypothetical protein
MAAQSLPPTHVDNFTGHPRVIILSDIGNEPDDQMSFVRLLLYSNELDIEARPHRRLRASAAKPASQRPGLASSL